MTAPSIPTAAADVPDHAETRAEVDESDVIEQAEPRDGEPISPRHIFSDREPPPGHRGSGVEPTRGARSGS